MFLGYSLNRKYYRFFNQRNKNIVECANVKVDEKVIVKARILDYNSNEKEASPNPIIENIDLNYFINSKDNTGIINIGIVSA